MITIFITTTSLLILLANSLLFIYIFKRIPLTSVPITIGIEYVLMTSFLKIIDLWWLSFVIYILICLYFMYSKKSFSKNQNMLYTMSPEKFAELCRFEDVFTGSFIGAFIGFIISLFL